jgi:hypothetical protein
VNPDLLEIKKQYDQKMDLLVSLGLAVRTETGVEVIRKKKAPLTESEIKRFEVLYDNSIELWTFRYERIIADHVHHKPIHILYNDETENPISTWFHTASIADPDSTFLFGDSLSNAEGLYGNFFVTWNLKFVSFTNPSKKIKTENGSIVDLIEIAEKNDAIYAIDEGTTHAFFGIRKFYCSSISSVTIVLL